ncbi:MAG: type II toxin-antitoxin system RelE/ParE family toxin [Propionibacteriaceae bacterium]|jgi:putative addiction module killer protein|nr:type II toxin-antitoxin system RelE/ParE family toxin [Propionibacteriaceae bacterium]
MIYSDGEGQPGDEAGLKFEATAEFVHWVDGLRDRHARARVLVQIDKMTMGNLGVVEPVGEGISEAKIDYGPGYRLYYKQKGLKMYLLLSGGNKSSQSRDIRRAKQLARSYGI